MDIDAIVRELEKERDRISNAKRNGKHDGRTRLARSANHHPRS